MMSTHLKPLSILVAILAIAALACSLSDAIGGGDQVADDPGAPTAPSGILGTPITSPVRTVLPPPKITDTPGPTNTPGASGCIDGATFVSDVTIPDDTVIPAGEAFRKTWSLQNDGSCVWQSDYQLRHVSGEQMGAPSVIPINRSVPAGTTTEMTVEFTAPASPGTYRGLWQLATAAGAPFGSQFWVQIVVPEPTVEITLEVTAVISQSVTPEPESPLDQEDTPPEGVEAQLGFFTPGPGPFCPLAGSEPAVGFDFTEREITQDLTICPVAFGPGELDVQVAMPDGSVRQSGSRQWKWTTLPGDPLGEYVVTATQGAVQATGSFTVTAASSPRILALTKSAPPGETFLIALAGFQPGQDLHLYGAGTCEDNAPGWCFRTTLPPPELDARGEAYYQIPTEPDDPTGAYLVHTGEGGLFGISSPEVFEVTP